MHEGHFITRVEKKEQYAALNKLSTKMPEESTFLPRELHSSWCHWLLETVLSYLPDPLLTLNLYRNFLDARWVLLSIRCITHYVFACLVCDTTEGAMTRRVRCIGFSYSCWGTTDQESTRSYLQTTELSRMIEEHLMTYATLFLHHVWFCSLTCLSPV